MRYTRGAEVLIAVGFYKNPAIFRAEVLHPSCQLSRLARAQWASIREAGSFETGIGVVYPDVIAYGSGRLFGRDPKTGKWEVTGYSS